MNFIQAGIVLLSISEVMIQNNVCALAATHSDFNADRVKIMMENGFDGVEAEQALKWDFNSLIDPELPD